MDFMISRLILLLPLIISGIAQAATGLSNPTLTNFNLGDFIVEPNGDPTNAIRVNLGMNRPPGNDLPGDLLIFIGGTNLWTNKAGIYYPTATNAQTIVVGRSAQAWWVPTLTDGFVSVHDTSAGDSQFNSLAIAAIDNVLQENYGQFTSTLGSGAAPAGALQLLAATNWQNPSAPISKFSVDLQPAHGEVLLDLVNNGIHDFSVSNQITSVQALQLVPITNTTLALGANQVNVQSNSYIALQASFSDPTTTEIDLSTGLRDGMLLLLQNVGLLSGFTLFNGSTLYDDPTKFVTLGGGHWATTNYGDGLLLIGGLNGWSEVGRFNQNTNIFAGQLWYLAGGGYYPSLAQNTLYAKGIHSLETLNADGSFRFSPYTNAVLGSGSQSVSVFQHSFVGLISTNADPSLTSVRISSGNGGGTLLILQNATNGTGFTLANGSVLTDDPAGFVRLNGDWITTNSGDGLLLIGGSGGWSEVGRFTQNTNVVTGDQLWELISGHMRTTPTTLDDWQFRYGGVPQLTISTNGGIAVGPNTLAIYGSPLIAGEALYSINDTALGDPNGSYVHLEVRNSTNATEKTLLEQGIAIGGGMGGYMNGTATDTNSNSKLFILSWQTNFVNFNFQDTQLAHGAIMALDPYFQGTQHAPYYFDTALPIGVGTNVFQVLNYFTNIFTIAADSGYTGSGANWFADDGKFHAAPGGGDVVGTLTSPKIPYATGAHAVADSNIEVANVNPARMWIFDDQTLSVTTGQLGTYTKPFSYLYLENLIWGDGGSLHGKLYDGIYNANPEGVLAADVGSLLRVTNGSPGSVLYVKETGLNTSSGWSPILTTSSGTLSITNGIVQRVKDSFSTNYVIGSNTNQQFFLLNGTNQLVTLPTASGVKDIIYRFSMTNGLGSFVITNAADGAKIRDGVSLSYTNIGVNEVGFLSDGSNWWLASKGKQIFPSASWSLGNTITPVQDVITNIPFTQLEFNNSQGIALRTKSGFTGATELAITNAGTYMITFSAVLKGAAGGSVISIWLRKDGVDVPRTRTDQGFTGTSAQQCMTVNYFVSVGTTPSYFELCAASHDATPPTIVSAAANPTGYTAPAMPGVIVTINRVSDTWP